MSGQFRPPGSVPNKNININSPAPNTSAANSPAKSVYDQNNNRPVEENDQGQNSEVNGHMTNGHEMEPQPGQATLAQQAQQNQAPVVDPNYNEFFNPALGHTLPLSRIVESVIQKSYSELTKMADILPNKTKDQRKIEIVEYAKKNRQVLIRLLALVKWAQKSAKKVEKCGKIITKLDQQSFKYTEIADRLHYLANDEIRGYSLPNFEIPAAVDVLTTGNYPRLPGCIVDKVIDEEDQIEYHKSLSKGHVGTTQSSGQSSSSDISMEETIKEISGIVKHKLVTSKIPKAMRNFKISEGCVQFHVKNEFLLLLTVNIDDDREGHAGSNRSNSYHDTSSWRCLDLVILTKDESTPERKLVHPSQLQYLKVLVQKTLDNFSNNRPLVEIYDVLHIFCLKLQLDLLKNSAMKLEFEGFNNVKILSHQKGQYLKISYWLPNEHIVMDSVLNFKNIFGGDDQSDPLQVGADEMSDIRSLKSSKYPGTSVVQHPDSQPTHGTLPSITFTVPETSKDNFLCKKGISLQHYPELFPDSDINSSPNDPNEDFERNLENLEGEIYDINESFLSNSNASCSNTGNGLLENIIHQAVKIRSFSILKKIKLLFQRLSNGCIVKINENDHRKFCSLLIFDKDTLPNEEIDIHIDDATGKIICLNSIISVDSSALGPSVPLDEHIEKLLKLNKDGFEYNFTVEKMAENSKFIDLLRFEFLKARVKKVINTNSIGELIEYSDSKSGPIDVYNTVFSDSDLDHNGDKIRKWFIPLRKFNKYIYTIIVNLDDKIEGKFRVKHYLLEVRYSKKEATYDPTDIKNEDTGTRNEASGAEPTQASKNGPENPENGPNPADVSKQEVKDTSTASPSNEPKEKKEDYTQITACNLCDCTIVSDMLLFDDSIPNQTQINMINIDLTKNDSLNDNLSTLIANTSFSKSKFEEQLQTLIASCESKISLLAICNVLDNEKLSHSGVIAEGPEGIPITYCVKLFEPPKLYDIGSGVATGCLIYLC